MTDDAKRWKFLLSGNVEVSHLYNEEGHMVGMLLETDMEIVECYSPLEVNAVIDRWISMSHFSARVH
jgi:hypothetical protein